MCSKEDLSLSSLSLNTEDWDHSESDISPVVLRASTPQNTVMFPGDGVKDDIQARRGGKEGRSLSELMRLHAEKGTDVTFSAEEASRVADVLKQWINSGTSPYEGEDDFFARAHDDASWRLKRSSRPPIDIIGRPRGRSESVVRRSANPENS